MAENAKRWDLEGHFSSVWGCALTGDSGTLLLIYSNCYFLPWGKQVSSATHSAMIPHQRPTSHGESGMETSKTMRVNKSVFLLRWITQVFYYSKGKGHLTYYITITES